MKKLMFIPTLFLTASLFAQSFGIEGSYLLTQRAEYSANTDNSFFNYIPSSGLRIRMYRSYADSSKKFGFQHGFSFSMRSSKVTSSWREYIYPNYTDFGFEVDASSIERIYTVGSDFFLVRNPNKKLNLSLGFRIEYELQRTHALTTSYKPDQSGVRVLGKRDFLKVDFYDNVLDRLYYSTELNINYSFSDKISASLGYAYLRKMSEGFPHEFGRFYHDTRFGLRYRFLNKQ